MVDSFLSRLSTRIQRLEGTDEKLGTGYDVDVMTVSKAAKSPPLLVSGEHAGRNIP